MLMGRKGENYPILELGEGTKDIPNGHFLDPFLFDLSAAFGHFFLSFSLSPYGPTGPLRFFKHVAHVSTSAPLTAVPSSRNGLDIFFPNYPIACSLTASKSFLKRHPLFSEAFPPLPFNCNSFPALPFLQYLSLWHLSLLNTLCVYFVYFLSSLPKCSSIRM